MSRLKEKEPERRTAVLLPVPRTPPESLDEATAQLRALRHNMRVASYLFAMRLARVRDHELFREGDFDGMEVWFHATFPDVNVRTMYRALAFADSIPGEVAAAYDPDKIDAGTRLLRKGRTGEAVVTLDALEKLSVKAVRNGKSVSVPFQDARSDELEAELARRRKRALPPVSDGFQRGMARLDRRLGSGVTRIGEVRHQRQGATNVVVITIAEDRLDEFEKLLK